MNRSIRKLFRSKSIYEISDDLTLNIIINIDRYHYLKFSKNIKISRFYLMKCIKHKIIKHNTKIYTNKDIYLGGCIEPNYIDSTDKFIQIELVKYDCDNIQYIDSPDKDIQLMAINENAYSIRYIDNPDKDVQLAAVKENKSAIKYIKNPHTDVRLAAVRQNPDIL